MKNELTPLDRRLSPFHKELLDVSAIDGEFRSFCEKTLFVQLPGNLPDAKELVLALSKAKEKSGDNEAESLTLQVLAFLEKIKIQPHDPVALDVFTALSSQYWAGKELNALEFLMMEGDFPKEYWRNILYTESDFQPTEAGIPPKEVEEINSLVADRISKGLIEFIREDPPKSSPYSIYFWLDRKLSKRPESQKSDSDEFRFILESVVQKWAEAQLNRNNENSIYQLLDWVKSRRLDDLVSRNLQQEIKDRLNERPISLPPYPMSLKDIPIFIKAVDRDLWDNGGGKPYQPSEGDRDHLHTQLEDIAVLCAEDRLKANLPISTIRKLIHFLSTYVNPKRDLKEDRLAIKLLALLRGQLQNSRSQFDVFDYQIALKTLVRCGKEADALRQLFLTLRTFSMPCCDESTEFRQRIRSYAESDLTPRMESLDPEFCLNILVDIIICKLRSSERLRQTCLNLGEFFLSRLKLKAKNPRKSFSKESTDFYQDKDCLESNPHWRTAYIEALGELGYAHNGKVLRCLDFIRKHDPQEKVRNRAQSVYRVIHREQTKPLDDWKGLRAAFWALRVAQRKAIGQPVDEAAAKLLKRQELRAENQTKSDGIYKSYLGPYIPNL